MWKPIVSSSKRALTSFLFPSCCLHCKELIRDQGLLCSFCSEQVERILDRGGPNEIAPFKDISTAIEPYGPFLSLLKGVKGGESALVAKVMGAFMVMALDKLGWPQIDCIIPSPEDLSFHKMIAQEVGAFLQVEVKAELALSFWTDEFTWRRKNSLNGKTLLVVSSVGPKDVKKFLLLEEAAPKEAFFLSFC